MSPVRGARPALLDPGADPSLTRPVHVTSATCAARGRVGNPMGACPPWMFERWGRRALRSRRLHTARSAFRCDLLEPCGQVLMDVVWVRCEDLGFEAGFAGYVGL
jgi:hypothetical protein